MDFDSIIHCKNCGSPEGLDCSYCGPKKPKVKLVNPKKNKRAIFIIVLLAVLPFPLSIPIILIHRRLKKDREQRLKLEKQISETDEKLNKINNHIQTLKNK